MHFDDSFGWFRSELNRFTRERIDPDIGSFGLSLGRIYFNESSENELSRYYVCVYNLVGYHSHRGTADVYFAALL